MRLFSWRSLSAVAVLSVLGGELMAQSPPRPAADTTVRSLSLTEVLQRVRQAVRLSGLTAEQTRARLHASGFRADLLDPYLGTEVVLDSLNGPSDEELVALRDIGIIDAAEFRVLHRGPVRPDFSPNRNARLRALADSQRRSDSLPRRSSVGRVRAPGDTGRFEDDSLAIFGMEIFSSPTSRFDPVLAGPVDANYRLGPGDQVNLILTGDVEETHVLEVSREGFVVIPRVGQLFVASLTLGQLEDILYTRLGRAYSGVSRRADATTRFSISVGRLRTNQIFVLGEVQRPGSYVISSAGTMLSAVYAAGGPSELGSFRDIQLRRRGTVVSTLDLYDYLLRGDAARDVRLETGDIIFVPVVTRQVRIVGGVVRPGTYELRAQESLLDLVAAAGGLRPDAGRHRVQIERIVPAPNRLEIGRERVTIDLVSEQLTDRAMSSVEVHPGDVVRFFPIADRVRNTIVVRGNVWNEGPLGLEPGMTLSQAVKRAGPKPDLFLGQVLVSRMRADSTRVQLRASFRDSTGNVVDDFPLQEDDLVEVFSVASFQPERYVAIGGAVRRPGRYGYRTGMTIRDLILLADGTQESAFLGEAEVARLPADRAGSVSSITIRVPLDSSYAFAESQAAPGASGKSTDFVLREYDNVLIKQQPNWELQRVVTLEGEVAFPGQYALSRRDERLADLIRRAGGLTAEAYPHATELIRRKDRIGRVALDLPTALRRARSPDNIVLVDGDHIMVPQRSFVVRVEGEVNAPNVVAYAEGQGLSYYIQQAGGISRTGDKGAVYITQPNGKRQTAGWGRDPQPLPGSIIVVPPAPPRAPLLQSISSFLSTIAGIVGTVILLDNVTR